MKSEERLTPVELYEKRRLRIVFLIFLLVALLFVVTRLVNRFLVDRPVDHTAIEEHFKYGSIGSEPGGSLFYAVGGMLPPYQIFKVLPEVCPERMGADNSPADKPYAAFGFIYEDGHDLPIGVSRRQRLGFDQVGLNCAVCHTGTYRKDSADKPKVVYGMPAHRLDLQRFFRFLINCTLDEERFTPEKVIERIEASGTHLSVIDRILYGRQVIPRIKETTRELNVRIKKILSDDVTHWGPGRVDTFNPYKAIQFNWSLNQLPTEELTGASDLPSLWNQQPRDKMQLHWDGNNDSLDERNLSAALGAGVTPVTVDYRRLQRVRKYISTLPAPAFPFVVRKDLAAKGEKLYASYCRTCHDFAGERTGNIVPIGEIKTDVYRLNSYTHIFASNQYTLYPDSDYRFQHFRKTNGYANHPLDGIWARAPYLHNGSVPTLRDLLEPTDKRPKTFYRGYDVYDQKKVGFVSDPPDKEKTEDRFYDTRKPGNHNQGHEGQIYGTKLLPAEKDALVEYMKTL